jgi:hypothetical protein
MGSSYISSAFLQIASTVRCFVTSEYALGVPSHLRTLHRLLNTSQLDLPLSTFPEMSDLSMSNRNGQVVPVSSNFVVSWGRKRFPFSLDVGVTRLSILKEYMSNLTGVPVAGMRLMHSGCRFSWLVVAGRIGCGETEPTFSLPGL